MEETDVAMEYDGADVDGVAQEEFEEDGGFENDIELGDDFQMRGRGRAGFRGRGQPRAWPGPPGPPGPRGEVPPRFRGRGFGPGGPPPFRGRGGPPPPMFGRGGPPRNPPPGPGFNGPPNFNGPNWGGPMGPPGTMGGPPSMMGPGPNGPPFGPPGMMGGPPNMNSGPPTMVTQSGATPNGPGQFPPITQNPTTGLDANSEIWVETKTAEGKSYFYNARTRETTWTKPEGPNVKVISQDQVEAMAQAATTGLAQGTSTAAQAALAQANVSNKPEVENEEGKGDNKQQTPAANAMQQNMLAGPPPGMPPFGGPPGQFGAPPFGLPPPGFQGTWPAPGQASWPAGPPGAAPWGMPPGLLTGLPGAMPAIDEAAVLAKVDPEIIGKAAEWSEHKSPDGRFYYYNAKKGESVWEKPQPLKDLENIFIAAKLAAAQGVSTRPGSDVVIANTETGKANAAAVQVANGEVVKDGSNKEEDDKLKKLQDESRKKKEEEEKTKEVKSQDKSRPVSSTPVPGTPWCVVWTGDGRVFFYNPSSRTSVWERPDELLKRTDVDKMVSTPPDAVGTPAKTDSAESPSKKRASDESESEEETPAKKPKKEETTSTNGTTPQSARKIDIGKEAAIEAEVRAAKERAVVPLENRIKSFKEMLAEKHVSAFSTWEKELHKIVFDSRYLLLTSKERKQVFEKYVKERAEEERREKRNKLREKKDAFRKLLSESHLHGKSSFSDFAQKFAKDERFKGVEKMRERESLFNEYLIEVRKREKEEKNQRREQVKKDFFAMLREHSDVDRHSHWADVKRKVDSDARYKAVDSSGQREDWFREYCKMLKEEKKKAKEKDREHKRDKEKHKKKDKDKDKERHSKDDKDKEKERDKEKSKKDEDGEASNKEVEETEPEETDDERAQEQREKDRQARAEASLREREKEVQRTLATHMRDRDKEREQHKRDEAIQHFNALLADLVRNPELSWREVKRILRKDHRWDLADSLSREDKEKLFNEHIEHLLRKKREKFRELLDETPDVSLTSTWKEIKRIIKEDPRYTKFASSERCEREFKDYLKDKLITAKGQFKELLQETKLITHKSLSNLRENQGLMQEIEDILKNDKRYLVLDHIPQERTQLILNYLEELDRRGPPPPPTASEPNRRSIK
ncbi:transcription elongation regulator 1 isoform X1 [Tenebrio molitor]|jgi:transcription elongation regulator 1|uniref:transcription elongation regulator 1 isoform X1 n=1 Tax=Tenebrio molitor TaxID=7067 RepID=UPI003624786E